jgi:hypothetical protein
MGFFAKLFAPKQPQLHADLPGPGDFALEIVGTSHHQTTLERIAGGRTEDSADVLVQAVLIFEDHNPHDANAVMVLIDGKLVGHLKRSDAPLYRQQILKAGYGPLPGRCAAKIVGGWYRDEDDRGYFGVRLDLPYSP